MSGLTNREYKNWQKVLKLYLESVQATVVAS